VTDRVLLAINALFAIALGAFLYNMLPYARAVGCGIERGDCDPYSPWLLVTVSALPAALVAVLWVIARRVRSTPVLARTLQVAVPLCVGGWTVFAFATSP
jgi:hypothetical protein